jgi:phosphoserine phosphatase
VGRLAAALGPDGYLATELSVVAARCRGAFTGPMVEGPRTWLALSDFADARSGAGGRQLAYPCGDSADDVPLLAHAGHVIAVNAQRKLTQAAVRCGWRPLAGHQRRHTMTGPWRCLCVLWGR